MENYYTCFGCGSKLIWDNDYSLSDVEGTDDEDDDGIVTCYHCSHCGKTYTVYDPPKEERENYPFYSEEDPPE